MKKRYLAILLATSMVFASVSSVSAMYEFSDGTSAEISGAGEDVDNSTDDEPELFSDDLTSVDSDDDGLELEMGQSAEIGFSDDLPWRMVRTWQQQLLRALTMYMCPVLFTFQRQKSFWSWSMRKERKKVWSQ